MLRILAMNALAGLGIAFLGVRFVHRWVSQPIDQLRQAAVRIGSGDFSHRVPVASRDEFGRLAGEVNDMARSIVAMQGQLVEQERRQVAAQALRCVVHNIRSPLTGIRWLAEAVGLREDVDARVRRDQREILATVDHILAWLSEFRQSVAQVSMQIAAVEPASLVDAVLADCGARAATRGMTLAARIDPDLGPVQVDRQQMAAALEAMLVRAIDSAVEGQSVELAAMRCPDRAGYWRLMVSWPSRGPVEESSPAARVGQPTGEIGMIDRVARLHGGTFEERAEVCGARCLTMTLAG